METTLLHIDYTKCIGCESCENICAFLYGKPNIIMTKTEEGQIYPFYCRHCENPGCVRACKRGAIVKTEDGPVLLQDALCEGCETKDCLKGCPYIAIYPGTSIQSAPHKCDLCIKQREKGQIPACISICPCNALSVKTREEIKTLPQEVKDADKVMLQHIKATKAMLF